MEVCTPVATARHKALLREILELQLTNTRNVWEMQMDGSYIQRHVSAEKGSQCVHHFLIEKAEKRSAVSRLALAKKKSRKKVPHRQGKSTEDQ